MGKVGIREGIPEKVIFESQMRGNEVGVPGLVFLADESVHRL